MPFVAPFDFAAGRKTIIDWFVAATGITVIWRDQSAPAPALPFASLLIIAGPTGVGGRDEQRTSTDLTVVQDVKITPLAQNSTKYTVTINGADFDFTSDASATVAEITAGLKAAIDGGSEAVSTVDNGTDLDVTSSDGNTFTLVLTDDFDGAQLSFENNDAGHEVLSEVVGLRTMTVSCQVYTEQIDRRDPTKDSLALAMSAQSALGLPSEIDRFRTAGLALVNEGTVTNIDEVIGDAFEGRSAFDVIFGLASNLAERSGFIKRSEISSDTGIPASLELVDELVGDIP